MYIVITFAVRGERERQRRRNTWVRDELLLVPLLIIAVGRLILLHVTSSTAISPFSLLV